jgi:hypothetical protein
VSTRNGHLEHPNLLGLQLHIGVRMTLHILYKRMLNVVAAASCSQHNPKTTPQQSLKRLGKNLKFCSHSVVPSILWNPQVHY